MPALAETQPMPRLAPRRVLVATQLGDWSASSLRVAVARAAGLGAELAVCHVGDADRHGVTRQALAAIGEAAIDCAVFAEHGDVAEAVARRASSWEADLLIVGGAKSGVGVGCRLWQSRVGWDIVQRAPCSVLITRHTPATGRMVVGTDLSARSVPVVRAAALEQARTGAAATLVHCVESGWAAPGGAAEGSLGQVLTPVVLASAQRVGLRATPQVVVAPTGIGIVDVATELAADLVVIGGGTRRRGGIAERVAREASCAVLLVA
jgi:nucleotide-binding universal stress UspA family protein